VLERGADRGATAVDLFAMRDEGRRFTLDGTGRESVPDGSAPELATRQNRRPLAVVLGEGGGGIDFDVDVPPGARFETAFGLQSIPGPSGNERHAGAVDLEILVRGADEDAGAPFERLASDPIRFANGMGAAWRTRRIDLSEHAGERVTLRLQAVPSAAAKPGSLVWWGSPRLVGPDAP